MSPQEVFEAQREGFRIFISGKDERELELLMNDIQLRLDYLQKIKMECFFPYTN